METAANTPPAGQRRSSISLRQSLFLRFGTLATVTMALLTLGYAAFGLQPVAERTALSHFSTAVEKVHGELDRMFDPVVGLLGISREWARHPGFDINRTEDFNRLFQPVLRQFPHLTSVVAGNTVGHGWMLLELPDNRWRNRFTDIPRRGKLQRFIDWDPQGKPTVREESVDYDARIRPWFRGAMSTPANGSVHWTEPYTFFTTKDPGITGSTRIDLKDGTSFVIGLDIKLLDISRTTAALPVGNSGGIMVITGDGRLLGLPRSERGADDNAIRSAVLKPVDILGIPAASAVVAAWVKAGKTAATDLRFVSGGENWIASFQPFRLGEQTFWTAAYAPVADFTPPWSNMLLTLCGVVTVVMLLALLMAHRFTRQFSAPLESLVASSERIARLDFSHGETTPAAFSDLQRLASAQERMRAMLSEFRGTMDAQSTDLKQQISALRATEARLEHLSQHDPLTDLPNRVLFNDRLTHAITRAHRSKRLFAVLFIDLDNFKSINDTRGHEAGDQLLVEVARRLRSGIREEDSVARLGGDEFVVLVEDLSDNLREAAKQAETLGEKIRAALALPYLVDNTMHHSTASIGVTLYRGENETGDTLLRGADGAMYRAKRTGRNTVQFFDPEMQAELDVAAQTEVDLREALPGGQLLLHFQGKYDRRQQIIGAEALLRWRHPQRGMVSPAEFIPIAENSGLILPIGRWVLEAACAQLKAWSESAHTRELRLAVNVSPYQFRHAAFIDDITRILEQSGADARLLVLELTESVVLDDVPAAISKMEELKRLGIKLSMDDFGTGYSSLSHLSRLPLDEVKIDQSFVRKLGSGSSDAAIVHAIIAMARSLSLSVVAEGVESREQLEWLLREECEGYQGYLFSRPVPVAQFEGMLGGENAG